MTAMLGLVSCGSVTDLRVEAFADYVAQPQVATLDVRTPEEYADGHLPWAANVDWKADGFVDAVVAAYPRETPLALYCRSGRRSAEAAAALLKAGYTSVSNLLGGYVAWAEAGKPVSSYAVETFFTDGGSPVDVMLIKHGTLAVRYAGRTLHVDPVGAYGKATDYAAEFPKADYIVVTHEHGDHYDPAAIAALTDEMRTKIVTNARVAQMMPPSPVGVIVVANGDVLESSGCVLEAVPAYNYTEGRTQFHPKGRDNGFVLTLDGLRIYVAGDTEDIPEMAELHDIDVAFLPVNQPYTMTVEQCVNAARVIGPRVLIPYHFGSTDLSALPALLPGVDVRLRDMQ